MQLAEPSLLTLLSITGRHVLPDSGDSFFFSKGARPGTTCLTKVPKALASNPGTCHRRFVALPLPPSSTFFSCICSTAFQAPPPPHILILQPLVHFLKVQKQDFPPLSFSFWEDFVRACSFTFHVLFQRK